MFWNSVKLQFEFMFRQDLCLKSHTYSWYYSFISNTDVLHLLLFYIVSHQVVSSSANTDLSCRVNNNIWKFSTPHWTENSAWYRMVHSKIFPIILFKISDRAVWQKEWVLPGTMYYFRVAIQVAHNNNQKKKTVTPAYMQKWTSHCQMSIGHGFHLFHNAWRSPPILT